MKVGNKVGIGSTIALYLGGFLVFCRLPFLKPTGMVLILAAVLGWGVAGVLKPRWWFVPSLVLIAGFVCLLRFAE